MLTYLHGCFPSVAGGVCICSLGHAAAEQCADHRERGGEWVARDLAAYAGDRGRIAMAVLLVVSMLPMVLEG